MKKSNESEKEIYKQKIIEMVERIESQDYLFKMVDYLKKALIYGHTSRISS